MSAYWCQPVDPLFVTRKAPSIFHASSTLLGLHAVLMALICVKCELLMPVHRASRSEGSKLDFGPKCVWFSSFSHSSVHELVFNNKRGLRFFFFKLLQSYALIIESPERKIKRKTQLPVILHPGNHHYQISPFSIPGLREPSLICLRERCSVQRTGVSEANTWNQPHCCCIR